MHRNVKRTIDVIRRQSSVLAELKARAKIAIIGAAYDVSTGQMEYFPRD
ncbi:MAG: hypothetical protein U0744_17295 [Gemmataceae bacterium]